MKIVRNSIKVITVISAGSGMGGCFVLLGKWTLWWGGGGWSPPLTQSPSFPGALELPPGANAVTAA